MSHESKDCSNWMCAQQFPPTQTMAGDLWRLFASRLTHKLETRPNSMITDAFTVDQSELRAYANPSLKSDQEGSCPDTPTTSRACSSVTSVEGTGLVPSCAGDAGEHTPSDHPEVGSNPSHTHGEPIRRNPSTSHGVYLKQR